MCLWAVLFTVLPAGSELHLFCCSDRSSNLWWLTGRWYPQSMQQFCGIQQIACRHDAKPIENERGNRSARFTEMSNGTYCRMKYAANLLLLFGSQLRFRWRLLDGCRPIANKVVLYIRKSALVLRLADRRHALIRNLICIAKHPAFPEI